MYGQGESGIIYKMSKEQYHSECDAQDTAEFFCQYFEVPMPILKKNHAPTEDWNFRGLYRRDTGVLSYNRDMTGLIIHALAHNIVHKIGRNGTGHHNPQFWEILQETHDLW